MCSKAAVKRNRFTSVSLPIREYSSKEKKEKENQENMTIRHKDKIIYSTR